MLCFVMPTVAKTNRWIQLFGIRFQPSELAKISLVLFFAYYCEAKKDKLNEWKTLLLPLGVLFVFVILDREGAELQHGPLHRRTLGR